MEIIILSKTVMELDPKMAHTSSQIFEIEFAKALTSFSKVNLVSLRAIKNARKDNVSLYSLNNKKSIKSAMKTLIESNGLYTESKRIMIMFGYDFFILSQLERLCTKYNAKLISFTFDSHKGAIEDKKGFRKFLVDTYFNLGIKKLNKTDGVILFNEEAYGELNLKIPYLVSRVGITNNLISNKNYKRNNKNCFKMVYAGSLTNYNGIKKMINTMKYLSSKKISLHIYGEGPLKNYVLDSMAQDERIFYGGILPKKEIEIIIDSADLLLNLRDTEHYVSKFSFPSKLIEYLASGVPILTSRVIKDQIFNEVSFIVEDFSSENIARLIEYIIGNPDEQEKRALLAKKYVSDNYLWDDVIKDVHKFFIELLSIEKKQ